MRDLLETQAVEEGVGQPNCRSPSGKEPEGGIAGRIGVDQQHSLVKVYKRCRQIDRCRALPHAPFRIGYREASHASPPFPGMRRRAAICFKPRFHCMLSVVPWFLVESFPRHQYPLVSWCLEIKPSRFPCSLETRQIGFLVTQVSFSLVSVGTLLTQLPWNQGIQQDPGNMEPIVHYAALVH